MQKEASPRGKDRDFWELMAQAAVAVLDVALWLHLMLGKSSSARFWELKALEPLAEF